MFFFLGFAVSMTVLSPSASGGGAGGGLLVDVISATLFPVVFEDWLARPLMSVEGNGGTLVVAFSLVLVNKELFC